MRDRQLLNVTLVKVFEMVLLSQSERDEGVHITMPSAMGWSIPSVDSVRGYTSTISKADSVLTRDDFWLSLEESTEVDVSLNAHIFLTAHDNEMSPQLKEVCAVLPLMDVDMLVARQWKGGCQALRLRLVTKLMTQSLTSASRLPPR